MASGRNMELSYLVTVRYPLDTTRNTLPHNHSEFPKGQTLATARYYTMKSIHKKGYLPHLGTHIPIVQPDLENMSGKGDAVELKLPELGTDIPRKSNDISTKYMNNYKLAMKQRGIYSIRALYTNNRSKDEPTDNPQASRDQMKNVQQSKTKTGKHLDKTRNVNIKDVQQEKEIRQRLLQELNLDALSEENKESPDNKEGVDNKESVDDLDPEDLGPHWGLYECTPKTNGGQENEMEELQSVKSGNTNNNQTSVPDSVPQINGPHSGMREKDVGTGSEKKTEAEERSDGQLQVRTPHQGEINQNEAKSSEENNQTLQGAAEKEQNDASDSLQSTESDLKEEAESDKSTFPDQFTIINHGVTYPGHSVVGKHGNNGNHQRSKLLPLGRDFRRRLPRLLLPRSTVVTMDIPKKKKVPTATLR